MLSLPLAALLVCSLPSPSLATSYSNSWAAECPDGKEGAHRVARDTGCQLDAEIIPGSNIYHFTCHHRRRRSTEPDQEVHKSIEEHKHVRWAEQQVVLSRKKRTGNPQWGGMGMGMSNQYMQPQQWRLPAKPQQQMVYDPNVVYDNPMGIQDPRFSLMWYLNRGGGLDMNVMEAWKLGITGKNIVVTILDDGIEKDNPDLVANYDPMASYDVNQNDGDPTPRYDMTDSNRHGTRCAGEVSATANNSICGVGVAYDSRIGGVRMLDGDVTDAVEARSLSLNNQHIDIYSASWGPDDDGKTVDGPGQLASKAFIQGVANGRRGKGSIFVWASGNGGRDHDNCNCDGYTNSIWTLSVSSATENGLIPWYSEACSSTMATTYSSGSSGERKVITTDLHNGCTSSHTGTSASAPMAAAVVALVLEANPELTWRDVQHITVRNCHVANLRTTDWLVNSLGRNYSHSFGYGIMDAGGMVKMAQTWTNVPEQLTSNVKAAIGPVTIPAHSSRTATMEVTEHGQVNFLEHLQSHITLTATRRGDVQIFLTSPAGTKSQLLMKRPHDSSRAGFHDWPFLTVFCWGEQPAGKWVLEVQNDGRYQVELHAWSLTFYGTAVDPTPAGVPAQAPAVAVPVPGTPSPAPHPAPLSLLPQSEKKELVEPSPPQQMPPQQIPYTGGVPPVLANVIPNCQEAGSSPGWCNACLPPYFALAGRCVQACPPEGYYQGSSNRSMACLQCYYTCKTCSGPNDYECTSCYGDASIEENTPGHKYCHNAGLVSKIMSSSKWYYVLTLGFMVNLGIVVVLVVYILRRRRARAGKSTSLLGGMKGMAKGYSPIKKTPSTAPFRDYEESSDEVEDFMKPYSDEPEDSPTFMKPYKDDEE